MLNRKSAGLWRAIPLCLFAATLIFCGGGGGGGGGGGTPAVIVQVTPATSSVEVNLTQTIDVVVTNAVDTSVTWQFSGGITMVSSTPTSVTVRAPATVGQGTVTARSNADLSKTDVATINFTPGTGSAGGVVQ